MINVIFQGNTNAYFFDAFDDIAVTGLTAAGLGVLDGRSGFVTTLSGTGLVSDGSAPSGFRGTITGISTVDGVGNPVLDATGMSWEINAFYAAVDDNLAGDDRALNALFSQEDIIFDASGAGQGTDVGDLLGGVTSNVTVTGSGFQDRLTGGLGNDVIRTGGTTRFDGDFIYGSAGNDTIDFSDAIAETWVSLTYFRLTGPLTFTLDGAANTGSVAKAGQGTDTLINPGAVLGWGLDLVGSAGNDVFNVSPGSGNYTGLVGDRGNDTFNITTSGTVRLDYNYSWQGDPTTGIVADLAAGVVSSDGHGGRDTVNVTDGGGRLELRGTRLADSIRGSDADERFILHQGNDTLDAGGGRDELRYDRGGVSTGIDADLGAGRVTGVWDGQAFVHTVSGIEVVRGSATGDDTIRGGTGDESLRGGGGDDRIFGGGGSDFLDGWLGDDYLNPGDDVDYADVNPHSGNDTVDAGDMTTGYLAIQHSNLADAGAQVITVDGIANTASVNKGVNGVTTVLDVQGPMQAEGLSFTGSNLGDTFDVTASDDGFVYLEGGRGNDSYTIGASGGAVAIGFGRDAGFNDATEGMSVDMSTGIVSNDGFGGRDTITVEAGAQLEVRGTDFGDAMTGSAGDDRFITRGGNDTVDGGEGIDRVRYDRSRITDGVEIDLAAGTAKGTWEGQAFTDSLTSIEIVRGSDFDDRISGALVGEQLDGREGDDYLYGDGIQADLTGDVAGQVFRMYQATLNRAPDGTGYEGWVANLFEGRVALSDFPNGFVGSREFQNTYGALDDAGFVNLLYNNVLERDADAGGLQGWLDFLSGGGTRAGVVLGFSESREFKNDTAADAAAFALSQSETHWTDDVYRVYRATLDRDPDAVGFAGWVENLGSGTSYQQMVGGFTGSLEFQRTYGALSDTDFVELLYQNVLDRASDAGGLQGWLDFLSGGGTREGVVEGFAQSGEFVRDTAADLKAWVLGQGTHDVIEAHGGGTNLMMGGILADRFVFETGAGTSTVADLESWDRLEMSGFGYADFNRFTDFLTQTDDDLVFSDQGTVVILADTTLADLGADQVDLF